MEPPGDPDLTIVLIGKTGAGKSSSANTILGQKTFESKLSLLPVTKMISERKGDVFGKRVRVVDTPGILDSKDTEKTIRTYCQRLLQSRRRCLFLVTVRVGRFTKEDEAAVRAAQRAIGPRGLRSTYLLFTGGDALKTKSVDDFIFEDKARGILPDVVQMFKGAYHLFNNEHEDEDQVFQLLMKAGLFTADSPDILSGDSKDRRIMLLGLPGAGKSSSGNSILRSQKFKSGCDFNPVSPRCQKESAVVDGRNITVVDTPGITDDSLEPQHLYLQMMRGLVEARPGPHAFVIVVKLGRIGKSESELLNLLRLIFGSDVAKYSMVLFTHGDDLGDKNIEDLIKSNKCVSELVSACGGRYCVFDNKAKQTRGQVRQFLEKIDGIVTANSGQHFTNSMLEMVETFCREYMNKKLLLNKDVLLAKDRLLGNKMLLNKDVLLAKDRLLGNKMLLNKDMFLAEKMFLNEDRLLMKRQISRCSFPSELDLMDELHLEDESVQPDELVLDDESYLDDESVQPDELVLDDESYLDDESVQPDELVLDDESYLDDEPVQPEESVQTDELVLDDESVHPDDSVQPEKSVQPEESLLDVIKKIWSKTVRFLKHIWSKISTSFKYCLTKIKSMLTLGK